MRKNLLVNSEYYHIFNRSIAKFVIFNSDVDYLRFIELMKFYRYNNPPCRFSDFKALEISHQKSIMQNLEESGELLVEIVAYCLMPTHFHLILKQISNHGITKFMRKVSDSYSKNFNLAHGRKGPLWESHFNSVLVSKDEQMLHLTRYLHLNPTTANLVKKPNLWKYSSYLEYLDKTDDNLCNFRDIIYLPVEKYKNFVLDQISYQKELGKIKNLLIDNYSG